MGGGGEGRGIPSFWEPEMGGEWRGGVSQVSGNSTYKNPEFSVCNSGYFQIIGFISVSLV